MKLNKKDKAFIKWIYRERDFGTNWKWQYPEEKSLFVNRLFPNYTDGTRFNMNLITFKEYPEVYTSFLKEELEYWRTKCSKIANTVQSVLDE